MADLARDQVVLNLYDEGATITQVAKEVGIHYSTVYRILERHQAVRPKGWKQGQTELERDRLLARDQTIVDRFVMGSATIAEIAKEVGLSYATVYRVLAKHQALPPTWRQRRLRAQQAG
jgi:transposase